MYIQPTQRQNTQQGFSLVEVVVVIGIFLIISATLLYNYGQTNARLTLDNKAHEVAQWVREAQIYAMGVKSSQGIPQTEFNGYGIHFQQSSVSSFLVFTDRQPGDKRLNPGGNCGDPGVECVNQVLLPNSLKIVSIRGISSGVPTTLDNVDIVFTRPNPDATITGDSSLGTSVYEKAEITLAATKGFRRTIDVWTTGQISVR
jgi:prepilin-type N-terminal cleavage/methylation domain-containing protein